MAQPAPLEPVRTSITVVEKIAAEAPASISTLHQEEIRETPGVNLDDRLRNVAGFSLFRRSSSLTAHPTTQGVSLRGIGSTGASRTLVLWDGVPINDPFGGWVYWTRVAPEELTRVEISRGSSTSVFGDRAMGGVIALFSREPERLRLTGSYEGGNHDTHAVSAGLAQLWSHWGASAYGRAFTTDGYFIVPDQRRGRVDEKAGVDFVSGAAKLDYLGGADRLFLRTDLLAEERRNGTTLQGNSTGLGTVAAHYSRELHRDRFSALAYHTREEFRSSFSAIAANRNSETPTFRQTVPAEATGAAGLWTRGYDRWSVMAGGDTARLEGYSRDVLFPTGFQLGGGTRLQHGLFGQADVRAGAAKFFVGARHDFTGADHRFFSPSAGLVVGRGRVRARASAYRSFRAPTLNELFRTFRVGNAVTQANAELGPEKLFGVEAGMDLVGESTRASVTVYRNFLQGLITNATLVTSPNLIVRQRRNAASVVARGLELEAQRRCGPVRAEASYLFVDSRFRTGERVPQVARHQGAAELGFHRGGTLASFGVRSYSLQFEDERNTFLLPGFASVQVVVRQRLVAGLSALLSIENLLDREYLVGFSPTPTIGPPRLWRAGLRWDGPLR